MNKMYYSKQTGGFYTIEIHGDNIPTDAVGITKQQHAALLQGQSEGKIIAADENGHPTLIDTPVPTTEQLASNIRRERDRALKALDVVVSNPLRFSELPEEQRGEAATYRRLLLDVPQQKGFPTTYEIPKTPSWLS